MSVLKHKENIAIEQLTKKVGPIITNSDKGGAWSLWTQTTISKRSISNYQTQQATNN